MYKEPDKARKLLFRSVMLMLGMFLFSTSIQAIGYEEVVTEEGIIISYKWRKYKRLSKNSPEVLMLKLKNLNTTKVTVNFRVIFHWEGRLHSSSMTQEYCMKAGQKIKGKTWELAFHTPEFSKEDYSSPFFAWYVDDLEVVENVDCKHGLKLKLEPSYPDKAEKLIHIPKPERLQLP